MERYETRVEGGTVYFETDEGDLEIGDLNTIVDVIGNETYTITYDEKQRTQAWLETDEDGAVTFDVRETIVDLDHRREFVEKMRSIDRSEEKYGLPERAVEFAEEIVSIFEQQGASTQTT
ncbi:hypothetical protein [Natronosalvus rutilus]|uniref:Uncharacterized protein n=1 Tax=Natronosalvus rutilus TaxID=2953753 RepID=A0A9E7SVP3_9EURY|nr:hypothetical protein [Natronosalvus rutilus]UTF52483.1 hypothetical protein NGM29_11850 [Natronosalvus rutilus]